MDYQRDYYKAKSSGNYKVWRKACNICIKYVKLYKKNQPTSTTTKFFLSTVKLIIYFTYNFSHYYIYIYYLFIYVMGITLFFLSSGIFFYY